MPRISALPPASRARQDAEIPAVNKDINTTERITVAMIMPTGALIDYAGATAPDGWLLCYGQTLNAVTNPEYEELYAAIGVTYGGTGITAFMLPDLRGRVVAGQDDMGGVSANRLTAPLDGDVLGNTGGLQTHTLTATEMPSHNHGIGTLNRLANPGAVDSNATNLDDFPGSNGPLKAFNQIIGNQWTGSMDMAGGGQAHNNLQPTIILNKIIKY